VIGLGAHAVTGQLTPASSPAGHDEPAQALAAAGQQLRARSGKPRPGS
jgi:hypothetical protein